MTYYICITLPDRTYARNISQLVSVSVSGHQNMGAKNPNLINEPLTFLSVTNRESIRSLGIKPEDDVRLSVEGLEGNHRSFNAERIKHVIEVFDEIKDLKLNVNPNVIYVD